MRHWRHATVAVAVAIAAIAATERCAQPSVQRNPSIETPAIAYHVETWVGYCHGGNNAGCASPVSTVRRWATYVQSSNSGAPKSVDVCNVPGHPCKSVAYIDDNNQYFGTCGWSDPAVNGGLKQQGTLPESAWLHSGSPPSYANRLFNPYNARCAPASANTGLWVNRYSTLGPGNALSWFNRFYQNEWGTRIPDYYMSDDTTVVNHFGGRPAVEYRSWTDLRNAQANWLSKHLDRNGHAVKIIFNGCNNNPYVVTGISLIKAYPNIEGCITENNISQTNMENGRAVYSLDNCARVSLRPRGGVYVNGPNQDETLLGRRQATALNLLCYVPGGRVVFWEEGNGNTRYINAFPEEGLYPTHALQRMSMPSGCPDETISADGAGNDGTRDGPCLSHGHNDLIVAGTPDAPVVRREFARCFDRGSPIGACAVIWNMTASPVRVSSAWLRRKYRRSIVANGGRIEEGGALRFSAAAVEGLQIAPYDALLLAE